MVSADIGQTVRHLANFGNWRPLFSVRDAPQLRTALLKERLTAPAMDNEALVHGAAREPHRGDGAARHAD